ncbi:MAG: hypothetical protein ACREBU_17975, partial [Nitrososphaera sp.]
LQGGPKRGEQVELDVIEDAGHDFLSLYGIPITRRYHPRCAGTATDASGSGSASPSGINQSSARRGR